MYKNIVTENSMQGQRSQEADRLSYSVVRKSQEALDFADLPQELVNSPAHKPVWVKGKLLVKRFLARDPLTSRAYFDAVDLTPATKPMQAEKERAELNHAFGFHFHVAVHADMLKIKSLANLGSRVDPMNGGGGLRGQIVGFSAASRKRLIEFMASVRYDTQLVFLTVTYPDRFPVDDIETWNGHLEAFRRRFERRYPLYRGIWRKELKERKSGEFKGMLAPHWHFIVFTDISGTPQIEIEMIESHGKLIERTVSPVSKMIEKWAKRAWFEIVDSGDEKHAQHGAFAVAIRNRRHAYKYISKYVAKEDSDGFAVGRRWGRFGDFDTTASRTAIMSQQEYVEFKRLVRRWLKARDRASEKKAAAPYHKKLARRPADKGCTLFGLGDGLINPGQEEDFSRIVYRLMEHAIEIARKPRPTLTVKIKWKEAT